MNNREINQKKQLRENIESIQIATSFVLGLFVLYLDRNDHIHGQDIADYINNFQPYLEETIHADLPPEFLNYFLLSIVLLNTLTSFGIISSRLIEERLKNN